MLRALFSLLLLCALWLPMGSAWLAFAHRKHVISSEVKKRIRQGVNDSELVLLHIPLELEKNPDHTFKRMHAGEFRYQGVMYDIARQELRGDTTWYWCILDWDDTELHNQIEQKTNKTPARDPAQRENSERLHRFWLSLFFETTSKPALYPTLILCRPGPGNPGALRPGFSDVPHPPPEQRNLLPALLRP